jgi:hypothetical protein
LAVRVEIADLHNWAWQSPHIVKTSPPTSTFMFYLSLSLSVNLHVDRIAATVIAKITYKCESSIIISLSLVMALIRIRRFRTRT